MNEYKVRRIGEIAVNPDFSAKITINSPYRSALVGMNGFSWINVIWWAHLLDTPDQRLVVELEKPYRKGPERLGIFATRSPLRPNPIMISPVSVRAVNTETGVIDVPYIDAENGTPVLDLKPYHGSTDRVDHWKVPAWCADWPDSIEASAVFDWGSVLNF